MISKVMPYVPVASLCTSSMCLFLQLKNMSNEVKHSTEQGIHMKNIYNMIVHSNMRLNTDLDTIKKNVEVIQSILEKEKDDQEVQEVQEE
jgi:regulator of replication initiation timing